MRNWLVPALLTAMLTAPAFGQPAQVPGYIKAKPEPLVRAYGVEIARRIFSDEFSPLRQAKIVASVKNIPGLTCPNVPGVTLFNVIPAAGTTCRSA